MGRPPIKKDLSVKQAGVWLHEELLERIRDRVGKQGFSAFMREAAERELKLRDKLKPDKGATEEP